MNDVFFAAAHIGIKAHQDRSAQQQSRIIICDGIGEFPDSAKAADALIEHMDMMELFSTPQLLAIIDQTKSQLQHDQVNGGTTMLLADCSEYSSSQRVHLAYIGNGSIFHFRSDLNELGTGYGNHWLPNRFVNLMLPHVEKDTALTRYVGAGVVAASSEPAIITMQLNSDLGDALMLVTDGIATLEEEFVMHDDAGRTWQMRSSIAHRLMLSVIAWLNNCKEDLSQKLIQAYLHSQLQQLKAEGLLEDDAAIGLLLTDAFIRKTQKTYEQAAY